MHVHLISQIFDNKQNARHFSHFLLIKKQKNDTRYGVQTVKYVVKYTFVEFRTNHTAEMWHVK